MTSSGIAVVNKSVGKTPLDCVKEYKKSHPDLKHVTVSYAGRLDPMAEGLLLLLIGEENKKRRIYEHLDKEYEVDVLFGITTDTEDLMGKVTQIQDTKPKIQNDTLTGALQCFKGEQEQRYPIYSSVKVQGKPLYWWARKNRLQEIQIPTHTINIQSIKLLAHTSVTNGELLEYIRNTIPFVKGDFRQDEITDSWRRVLDAQDKAITYPVIRIKVMCGSGTYIRMLAKDIGRKLKTPSCAYTIRRTRIGEFTRVTS